MSGLDLRFRALLLSRLKHLRHGRLVIRQGLQAWHFGNSDLASVEVIVVEPRFYRSVVLGGATGAGEAYQRGEWLCSDLVGLIRIVVQNASVLENMNSALSSAKRLFDSLKDSLRPNSLTGARSNIAAHYDLSNAFFSLFLDSNLMYSAALYPSQDATLDEASELKCRAACEKLQLTEQDHLLEIGTGWGGMALYAARHYGCRVTTTTLSREQYEYAAQRVYEEGLEERVTVLNKDYRELEGSYDKLISIEMIEAVGHRYFKQFFGKCAQLLKSDGLALIQAITLSHTRFEKEKNRSDFIRKCIFPGGCLPSSEVIIDGLRGAGAWQLVNLEDMTAHYARTLSDWRERFLGVLPEVRSLGFDDDFIRMWDFYLAYCQAGFEEREIFTVQLVFSGSRWRGISSPQLAY